MGLFRSKSRGDDDVDFSPLLPIDSGALRPLQESERAVADLLRVKTIGAILDPAAEPNCFTKVVPDGASFEEIMSLANQRPDGWVMRDVTALASIPAVADAFAGVRRVLVSKGADDHVVKTSPYPPYFTAGARKGMRRVQEMAALGFYWGWEECEEGWHQRGPGNPGIHDIRGPEDVSQYDQLCPLVRWR